MHPITPTPQPFVALNFPGPLGLNPAHTSIHQVKACETHNEAITLYRECKTVEKALLRHIQTTIDENYIKSMV